MWWARRLIAAMSALGMALAPAFPAAAAGVPHPRSNEWWFAPWSIEQKIWPITQGQGVTVAVLDSGVNAKMPEIAGAILPGGDTSGRRSDGRTDFDKSGHGTGMAVLIAGQGGGSTELVGIAPRVQLLPVTVIGDSSSAGQPETRLAAGIRLAVDRGAQVVNMSLGTPGSAQCPPEVMDAIAYAVRHDVVLVAAAGNTGNTDNAVDYPASCPGVLAVGATDDHSRPWSRTQVHDYVSVAAPGVDTPTVANTEKYYYPHSSGTSNAAALVSGAAALVRSANPTMPAREVVHRLIGTALDVSTPGRDDWTGYGIVRINRALDTSYVVPASSPNPPYQRFDQWQNPPTHMPTSATGHRRASRKGVSLDQVILAMLVAVAGGVVVVSAGRFVRQQRARPAPLTGLGPPPGAPPHDTRPHDTRPHDTGPHGTGPEGTGPAGPHRDPAAPDRDPARPWHQGDAASPAGFGKRARPTFEPPPEDHLSGD